ncbi:hypothetical protein [Sulfurovum sp.]|jgi:hypothetical protein|uniref:hypothetical protein n=1 Tax=Sulfurovum sp. TaxID=1969726 RepID=UPI002A36E87F|nr:hypothetical protein [Sulfurovum sp.]MDY0403019.1 hypothetical protein [Sulfurovum sp.]
MKSLFQEIEDLNSWDYYDRDEKCEIPYWNDNSKHQEFIKNFLKISRKELVESHFFTNELRDAGISFNNFERATHTNSVFFIGSLLYEKLLLKDKINFVREDGKDDEFHFIWFLTSLVHDFGYFAEKYKSKFSYVTEDIASLNLTHNLLDFDTGSRYLNEAYDEYKSSTKLIINEIPNYFKEAFNGKRSSRGESKIEHGIYAGLLLYDGLVKNRIERKEQQKNGVEEGLYWKDDLDKFYAIASFAIAIHNMRRDGIVENPEDLKFSIEDEPFLFLFALADTIEPIKTYGNENPEDVLKNILIDVQEDKIILQNASDSKLDFSEQAKKVCNLASWMDVKVCNEGNTLTIKINNKFKDSKK